MTPGNAKDLSVRSEISKSVWHDGRCSEQLLAIAKSAAQFHWPHFQRSSRGRTALYFSLSPNVLPVVLLTRCTRAQAGQVTTSWLSLEQSALRQIAKPECSARFGHTE